MSVDGERNSVAAALLCLRSARIAAGCGAAALALPVLLAAAWLWHGPEELIEASMPLPLASAPAGWQIMVAIFLSFLPALAGSLALLSARRCFAIYAAGGWFTEAPARALASCGQRLLIAALLGLIVPTLIGLVLTVNAPPGSRVLTVSLSSGTALSALLGVMVWLFADVQSRAARLAHEHAQIV